MSDEVDIWVPGTDLPSDSVHILALAAHPDDAELGVGGIMALHSRAGFKVGVLDLTRGEMSTNGTPGERLQEAGAAAMVLGLFWRGNMCFPDAGLEAARDMATAVAGILRSLRPRLLLLPHTSDWHPDHVAASWIGKTAAFLASLSKADILGDPLPRPVTAHYPINGMVDTQLVVDVTGVYEDKRASIRAHASQFDPSGRQPTSLNDPAFLNMIESRDALCGSRVGAGYAEALEIQEPLALDDLSVLLADRRRKGG